MTDLSRRDAMRGAGAAVAVATVAAPAVQAADSEEAQVLALFRQLDDGKRALTHFLMRAMARLPDDPTLALRFRDDHEPAGEAIS